VSGFDFFRTRRTGYSPRTPAAALKAVGIGTVPAELFIHASASAKPLDEEPFDRDVIERVLARTDLTLPTSILLKRVLGKLISSREQEIALFGAEGINALETRALTRIEKLKSSLSEEESRAGRRQLAREYYELAELHAGTESVRAFYLKEAYASLRKILGRGANMERADLALAVDILVALGLHAQAVRHLERMRAPDDPEVVLLTARVAFHRRDYRRVAECCRKLSGFTGSLGEKERRIVSYWAERDG
jgi:hypothetical protein